MKKQKKFRYIKKGQELELSSETTWETWYLKIGFEVNSPRNMKQRIKFDEKVLQKIRKLLVEARNNDLFNKFANAKQGEPHAK